MTDAASSPAPTAADAPASATPALPSVPESAPIVAPVAEYATGASAAADIAKLTVAMPPSSSSTPQPTPLSAIATPTVKFLEKGSADPSKPTKFYVNIVDGVGNFGYFRSCMSSCTTRAVMNVVCCVCV